MNFEIIKSVYKNYCMESLTNPLDSHFKEIKYPENISDEDLTIRKLKEICLKILHEIIWCQVFEDVLAESKTDQDTAIQATKELEDKRKLIFSNANKLNNSIATYLANCTTQSMESFNFIEKLQLSEIYAIYLENYVKPTITSIIKDKDRQNISEEDFIRNHRFLWEVSIQIRDCTDIALSLIEVQQSLMGDEEYVRKLSPRQQNKITNLVSKYDSLKLNLPQTFNSINMLKDDYIAAKGRPYSKSTMQIYTRVMSIFIPQLTKVLLDEVENFM